MIMGIHQTRHHNFFMSIQDIEIWLRGIFRFDCRRIADVYYPVIFNIHCPIFDDAVQAARSGHQVLTVTDKDIIHELVAGPNQIPVV